MCKDVLYSRGGKGRAGQGPFVYVYVCEERAHTQTREDRRRRDVHMGVMNKETTSRRR